MRASSRMAGLLGLGLVTSTLSIGLSAPATANPAGTNLVITEVYGGGGNSGAPWSNDFIELYNPTAAPISVDGWSVQGRSATNTSAASGDNVTPLSGSVPAGGYYLVQQAAGSTVTNKPLPTPNATGNMAIAAGGWQIWLATTTTGLDPADGNVLANPNPAIVDFVGGATSAISFETARVTSASSNTTSIRRTNNADTDNNAADFATGAPTPQASVQPLSATSPGDQSIFAGEPMAPLTLRALGGTQPYSWEVAGLPAGVSETSDGVIGGTPTEAGTSVVTATVTDSSSPAESSSVEFSITVEPEPVVLPIAAIQGTGSETPYAGKTVITQGVVTASYPSGSGNFAGFYLQTGGEEGVDHDTPGASDAIFVFSGSKTAPAVGATVEVRGVAGERFGSTQLNSSASASTITVLADAQPAVVPNDVVPGTDCALPGTDCLTGAALDAAREEYEGELFQPTGDYTVTDSYDGSAFDQSGSRGFAMQGEIGLAAESDLPLVVPTEKIDQSDASGLAARRAYNEAHRLILDDGADIDYTSNNFEDTPFPWLTPGNPVRVGAAVTFPKPVVLRFDFGFWRLQPQTKVAGGTSGADRVAFENTRTPAPEDVLGLDGDLTIATFNMLNYFNTFGEDWAASDGTASGSPGTSYDFGNPRRCSYYTDRGPVGGGSGALRLTNNECAQDAVDPISGNNVKLPGPRGAANEVNFLRQEAKELEAINAIDADIMSLEEVENSIKLYDAAIDGPDGADRDRDDALRRLVDQLNAHWALAHPAHAGDRWAFVPSPRPEALPTVTEQDAIRNAFIYDPSTVELVGRSQVLVNSAPFRNAREPLAQAFKPVGGGRADAFGVIVNHFKSKGGPQGTSTVNGDNVDSGDGAGFYNGDRKRQAAALVAFADQFAADKNIGPMFLTGDFNAYSAEDPVQVIEDGGFTNLKPANGETSYSFAGLAGSLDHVFANDEALEMVTGTDIWAINAGESVYYEYSRYNANAAELYAVDAFRSSDHNPEIIGIDTGVATPDPDVDTVQLLATNDFHGRLLDDPGSAAAGAASLAGAVKELRAANPDTVFAAAGDLIGASTFESFIQNDEPTIDALNEAGLEVSAVGNHEFDRGYADLVERVMPRTTWEYIGANVVFKRDEHGHAAGDPALPETWCQTLPGGRVVGFVGAVTEDLPTLVAGAGIDEIVVTDVVDAVNEHADELKGPGGCGAAGPADLVVELVHEGAATTSYSAVTNDSTFGRIVAGANENVDAIVSGHTHLAYNHKVPVQAWIDEGRAVTTRPVVSAGQYGAALNRLQFEFAPGGGELLGVRQTVLQLKDFDPDPATQAIVDEAAAYAETEGSRVLGEIEDPFWRARRIGDDGQVVENRGGESSLGNLIAEMQRWRTGADLGFMNPGGLRADLRGLDGTPRQLTYRQAANAQPFANTLVTMDLTGAEVKQILEQQWQRDADGNIPSRPFLRLGTSEGFTSTYDPSRPEGDRITGMWLDGEPLGLGTTYRVSATSFLAGTGDNFWGFGEGENRQDTGKTDLEAVVDYLAATAAAGEGTPLVTDYGQRQVGVSFAAGQPEVYEGGDAIAFALTSLAMTGDGDDQDSQVRVSLGSHEIGTFPVTSALPRNPDDEAGTATVTGTMPATLPDGTGEVVVEGLTTGTRVVIPVRTSDGLPDAVVTGADSAWAYGQQGNVTVSVDPATATGTVTLLDGATELGSAELADGTAVVTVAGTALEPGVHDLELVYSGDAGNSGDRGTVQVTVAQAATTTDAQVTPTRVVVRHGVTTVQATVSADGFTPVGEAEVLVDGTRAALGTLEDGRLVVELPPFDTTGSREISVRYLGDARAAGSTSATTTVKVVRATPTITATVTPGRVTTKTPVTLEIDVTAPGQVVTGWVGITWDGGDEAAARKLSGGSVSFDLGRFKKAGTHTVWIAYAGSDLAEPALKKVVITVEKK